MRAGGCTLQQGLTAEATSVVKQALALARCRGHAQVSPLHVANTMLAASTGLLRKACLQSHSHPLQCKALELCFNVALNRLPASSANPILGNPNSQHPSLSNALVAAFKRAQAHQRRGSIENQQQPLLAMKIELEQLMISILDDPSVSRVMREAGFSSTQVKSNVEQVVSLELNKLEENTKQVQIGVILSRPRSSDQISNEDVMSVIGNLMNRRRKSLVIVGECLEFIEGVIGGVMDRVDKRDVPEVLREVKFINLPLFSSTDHISKEDVENKLGELKSHLTSFLDKGVVLYLGDLRRITENRVSCDGPERSYYCPMDHLIMELGKMIFRFGEKGKFWLMGIATFQTYMRCRTGQYSLETVWGLHPITVPSGSLSLSLIPDSDTQSESRSKKSGNGVENQLTCCADCSSKFENEVRRLLNGNCISESTTSSLPSWLQIKRPTSNYQDCVSVRELGKKWNSICSSIHKQYQPFDITLKLSSPSPASSTSCFSYDPQNPNLDNTQQTWPISEHKQPWRDHQFWTSLNIDKTCEPSLKIYIPENQNPKQAFSTNPNSTTNSASSSDMVGTDEYIQRFKEFNAENLNTLCNALEKKVPWQKNIIPEIVGTILQCRSGMLRSKEKIRSKEESWFLFQGVDEQAKEKISRELAKVVFGSHSNFVSISLSNFSSTRSDSTEDFSNKRSRDEQSCSYIERFSEAVSSNPHRVFFVEDVEQADYFSQIGIKKAIERGRISNSNGEDVCFSDAIIILSCESFSARSRVCTPPIKQKLQGSEEEKGDGLEEISPYLSLDLNISFGDNSGEDQSIDDIGLLESVDRCIIFNYQESK